MIELPAQHWGEHAASQCSNRDPTKRRRPHLSALCIHRATTSSLPPMYESSKAVSMDLSMEKFNHGALDRVKLTLRVQQTGR